MSLSLWIILTIPFGIDQTIYCEEFVL